MMKRLSLKQKILMLVLGLTVASQSVYLYLNVRSFNEAYYRVIRSNLETIGTNLQENLQQVLNMGISIDRLTGMESFLRGILSQASELNSVAIHDLYGKWLYYCDRDKFLKDGDLGGGIDTLNLNLPQDKFLLTYPLAGRNDEPMGGLLLHIDRAVMEQKVKEIALDSGTVILISVLAIMDFLFFIVAYTITVPLMSAGEDIRVAEREGVLDLPVQRTGVDFLDRLLDRFDGYREHFKEDWLRLTAISQSLTRAHDWESLKNPKIDEALSKVKSILNSFRMGREALPKPSFVASPVLIRPAIFIFVFSEALSVSFLPLFAKALYRPIWTLSQEVVVGLPISAFMFFAGISLPLGGSWSDLVGRKNAFLAGALISGVALFLTGTAADIISLIIYRSLAGFGFGIVFMTAQGYIIDTTTTVNRAEGMAMFISAFYTGTLCGSAIGGMLADRIGFRAIFFMGAALATASICFLYLFMTEGPETGRSDDPSDKSRRWSYIVRAGLPSPRSLLRLFSDRDFASLVLFQSIPSKICLIGFVYYVAPLFLRDLGSSQSDTGRYVMGYSLMMILLSGTLSRWSDRAHKTKTFIFWGGTLSGIALILFFFFANTYMVALGILFLGLSHAFSVSNQAKLATELDVMRQIGFGEGMGIYRQAERVGNVLAPILVGFMVSYLGYAKSLGIIGVYGFVSSMLFLFLSRRGQM